MPAVAGIHQKAKNLLTNSFLFRFHYRYCGFEKILVRRAKAGVKIEPEPRLGTSLTNIKYWCFFFFSWQEFLQQRVKKLSKTGGEKQKIISCRRCLFRFLLRWIISLSETNHRRSGWVTWVGPSRTEIWRRSKSSSRSGSVNILMSSQNNLLVFLIRMVKRKSITFPRVATSTAPSMAGRPCTWLLTTARPRSWSTLCPRGRTSTPRTNTAYRSSWRPFGRATLAASRPCWTRSEDPEMRPSGTGFLSSGPLYIFSWPF